ncbi:S1 family peptidase [Treponema zioleckii]|uniref:S1 family peptidase n=1 Tax=Treponema zioleckii TaxID=331680 RepID=UPI00168A87CF|nr:serine protease [Treponema zioleckii]
MKKLFVAIVFFVVCTGVFAQVKNFVGIVRESHYPEFDDFLSDLSKNLKARGYSTYAEIAEAYKKGGFGSGFVFVDSDGENYIITNRHVVSQAASASIEFENENGDVSKFENLSVWITDDDIDLAILRFDGGSKPFSRALLLSGKKLRDGEDVFSAGFPALAGEPVWQFGRGSITNSAARIKDLIDPSVSVVIQHSAQIDAGNSGGPLLVWEFGDYRVIGVNTWKAAGRDSTNFAIPVALVKKLIENAKNPVGDDSTMQKARAEKFKNALTTSGNDFSAIVKFISYDFAAKKGEDYFDEILRHGSTKVRNRVVAEFSADPIEGLRYAVAYNVFNRFSGENVTEEELSKIQWQKEHGLFRIASIADEEDGKKAKNNANKKSKNTTGSKKSDKKSKKTELPEVSFEGLGVPYTFALGIGGVFPIVDDAEGFDVKPSFDFSLSIFPGESSIFGVFIELESGKILSDSYTIYGGGLSVRIPLDFSLFCISPKVSAGVKTGSSNPELTQGFLDFGLETQFNLGSDRFRPGIEASYRKFIDSVGDDVYTKDINVEAILIKLTLGVAL